LTQGTIYVSDAGSSQIDIFSPGANGNVAPEQIIAGADWAFWASGPSVTSVSGRRDAQPTPNGRDLQQSNQGHDLQLPIGLYPFRYKGG
jgi:hypothetical protein